jgi:hypothetical protein
MKHLVLKGIPPPPFFQNKPSAMHSADTNHYFIAFVEHLYKQMAMPVPESYPAPCAAHFELDGQLCITLQNAGERLVMWCDFGAHPSVPLKAVLQLNSFSSEAAPFVMAMNEDNDHLVAWKDVPSWTHYEMQGQAHPFFSEFSEACFQLSAFLKTTQAAAPQKRFMSPALGPGKSRF